MLLTRLGSFDCCLVTTIVIMATMLGHSSAQNNYNTTIVNLSDASALYDRTIVVPRVPMLRFLLPLLSHNGDQVETDKKNNLVPEKCLDTNDDTCSCYEVETPDEGMDNFILIVTFNRVQRFINISIDETFQVGCRHHMHPQNATIDEDGNSPGPITLTCEPVPVVDVQFESTPKIQWRKFSQMEDLTYFIGNCSNCTTNCTNRYTDQMVESGDGFMMAGYNLTIMTPESNQAWFVPSFSTGNSDCTFVVAPYTYLYRWPTITTNYDFSLEVVEPASNYSRLVCEANSFPPIKMFKWMRDSTNIHVGTDRYIFSDVTANRQVSVNGRVTITKIMFEDSGLYTCEAIHPASQPGVYNTSLSVTLRVKSRYRPLWPAIGIVAVGIVVTLFIIIGHFVDREIEKHQNEPSNPSHHKRLQSITSTMDNESSSNSAPSGKKQSANQVKYTVGGHTAVKRLSSAKIQLLEEPPC